MLYLGDKKFRFNFILSLFRLPTTGCFGHKASGPASRPEGRAYASASGSYSLKLGERAGPQLFLNREKTVRRIDNETL